ncbi:MAG TPA: alpha/beta fold hydrolase [Gemmataceae bacterium]|jgi:dipeptidyl aminopeptidase/acylaminoacyl peptidase|nr:alpha/beta fold hydrolase [Gemmataceae bacterium]
MRLRIRSLAIVCLLVGQGIAYAQPHKVEPPPSADDERTNLSQALDFAEQTLTRKLDEQRIVQALSEIAVIDTVRYTGPPPRVAKNPTAPGAKNPVIIPAYTFMPKKYATGTKLPLMLLVHGGVHGHFNSDAINVVRELLQQGYAVIATDYRGSTGYGREFWELIDYGGLENEDVFAGRQFMLENHDDIDPDRVGIMGWSHGGMITLMNLFAHPKEFKVGYAAVPVCDLVARMGYHDQGYRDLFSAPYHVGKTVRDDIDEYRRRSPVYHADKLQTPLLIHTTTNDEDVHVLEVENMMKALTAAGKSFESKVYKDAPGGHQFNRLDSRFAKESRAEVYRFLAKQLNPPNPAK